MSELRLQIENAIKRGSEPNKSVISQLDAIIDCVEKISLLNVNKDLLEALEYVKKTIESSDSWWMDLPDKGGFNLDIIDAAISKAKGLNN